MNYDIMAPIVASIITLILTKTFDYFMTRRKEKVEDKAAALLAIDEIAIASKETIQYVREQRDKYKELYEETCRGLEEARKEVDRYREILK